jgi:hypothetical protein
MLRRTLALTALTLGLVAAPAGAATFTSGLNLTMTPFAGESNQIILSLTTSGGDTFWVVTRDNAGAAPVSAGSSCTQQTAGAVVRCEITGIASLSLGDGNDKVTKTANGHGAILNGETGADTLVVLDTAAATLSGGPDNDYLEAVGPLADTLSGDAGDDQLKGGAGADVLNGGPGTDTFLAAGGTWTVSLDDVANDGVSPAVSNVRSDVENITGGSFGDTLTGSAAGNVLRGGGGGDTLDAKGGADQLFGETGDDQINARDGAADTIDCGDGNDTVQADALDTVIGCETVNYPDGDGDGSPANVDCDDANPAIRPGAHDVPGNGVDEDCSGADTPKVEPTVTPTPTPTATATPTPTPTATTVPDHAHDTTPPTPVPDVVAGPPAPKPLDSIVTATFSYAKTWTRFDDVVIRNARAGSKVVLTCKGKGCPKSLKPHTIAKDAAKLTLKRPLGNAKLKVGTRLEVRVERAGSSIRTRYTVRPDRAPKRLDF